MAVVSLEPILRGTGTQGKELPGQLDYNLPALYVEYCINAALAAFCVDTIFAVHIYFPFLLHNNFDRGHYVAHQVWPSD